MKRWNMEGIRGRCMSSSIEDIIPDVLCDITGGRPHLRDIGIIFRTTHP
jgi:hypothetical protein